MGIVFLKLEVCHVHKKEEVKITPHLIHVVAFEGRGKGNLGKLLQDEASPR